MNGEAIVGPPARYRPGDREDFDRLYRDSYGRLLGTLTALLRDRASAEDCVQEAFLRAYRAWPRYRADAPPEAWLHRIAINLAHNERKRTRLREIGELVRRLGAPPPAPDPAENVERQPILDALRRLPAEQAAALILRHLHGYSNREIGFALEVSESTVSSRLRLAVARLQRELRDDFRLQVATGRS